MDLDLGLVGADGAGDERAERGLHGARVASLGRGLGGRAAAPSAPSPWGHSIEPDASVIVTLAGLRFGTLEETSEAMPRTAAGSRVDRVGVEEHGRGGGLLLVGEEVVLGQRELHLGAGDAVDLPDGLGDLALEGALVGDLLLEGGGAELLLVEELEAGLRAAAGQPLAGEGDARLGLLAGDDGDGGAVVLELVGDAGLVERGGDLAGLGGSTPAWSVV